MRYQIAIKDSKFDVEVIGVQAGIATVVVNGEPYEVTIENYAAIAGAAAMSEAPAAPVVTRPAAEPAVAAPQPASRPAQPVAVAAAAGRTAIVAPMPGLILDIKVNVGGTVNAGEAVAILEAMKMENNIFTGVSGQVVEIPAPKGTEVGTGDIIMIIG